SDIHKGYLIRLGQYARTEITSFYKESKKQCPLNQHKNVNAFAMIILNKNQINFISSKAADSDNSISMSPI
ncbi:MAG: hypothetical protein NC452_11310, partial [Eubacterium sp.]|nr:hypothetical protein [Eubacterium sp.]